MSTELEDLEITIAGNKLTGFAPNTMTSNPPPWRQYNLCQIDNTRNVIDTRDLLREVNLMESVRKFLNDEGMEYLRRLVTFRNALPLDRQAMLFGVYLIRKSYRYKALDIPESQPIPGYAEIDFAGEPYLCPRQENR